MTGEKKNGSSCSKFFVTRGGKGAESGWFLTNNWDWGDVNLAHLDIIRSLSILSNQSEMRLGYSQYIYNKQITAQGYQEIDLLCRQDRIKQIYVLTCITTIPIPNNQYQIKKHRHHLLQIKQSLIFFILVQKRKRERKRNNFFWRAKQEGKETCQRRNKQSKERN